MKTRDIIYLSERNQRGAIVIYGIIGIKQYYYYTEREARHKYIEEARKTILINQK